MCQRGVYLYLVPVLSPEESVYLKLPYCLQAYPFGAYLTCISMLDGFTSMRRSAFLRDSSIVAFTASMLPLLTISC